MTRPERTILYDRHRALGAQMVEFGGWEMPLQYPSGVVEEHLSTRNGAGLFDVSHMGRFVIRGANAIQFLQHVLTNNVEALDLAPTGAQYTLIANETGGAQTTHFSIAFLKMSICWSSTPPTGKKTGTTSSFISDDSTASS